MTDADNWWVYIVDADTVQLCEDDGDLSADCGTTDPWLDCTNIPTVWQSMVLRPRQADGSDPTHRFRVTAGGTVYFIDASTPQTTPYANQVYWGMGLHSGGFEAEAQALDTEIGITYYRTERYSGDYESGTVSGVALMDPGDCLLLALGYAITTDGEIDTLAGGAGQIEVTDAMRGVPVRTPCNYNASGPVGATCMRYGRISNLNATEAIELELDPFVEGMDFLVVNESGFNLSVDPNGTEQFSPPMTDNGGDKLTSDTAGEAIRVYVPTSGQARVELVQGTWQDDGP
jgi:hypothetical protein